MGDEQDDLQAQKEAIEGLENHQAGVRARIRRVTSGQERSGISCQFGSAADLIPPSRAPMNRGLSATRALDAAPAEVQAVESVVVNALDGSELWRIELADGSVVRIDHVDGWSLVETREPGLYVVVDRESPTRDAGSIDLISSVVFNAGMRSVFWHNLSSTHAVTLLASGWRIDQHVGVQGRPDGCLATTPAAAGTGGSDPVAVKDVTIDVESGEVGFEIVETGKKVSMRCGATRHAGPVRRETT